MKRNLTFISTARLQVPSSRQFFAEGGVGKAVNHLPKSYRELTNFYEAVEKKQGSCDELT